MSRTGHQIYSIKHGLDIPIDGAPEQRVHQGAEVSRVAVLADDFIGMRPRMHVQLGDPVRRGQLLFEDRKNDGVRFTAWGSGKVAAIHRGARRALRSVVIDLDEHERAGDGTQAERFASFDRAAGADPTSGQIADLLLESGLWTAFRIRPFGRIPAPGSAPRALFVTAIDAHPLAADPTVLLDGRQESFRRGMEALSRLAGERPVYLCRAAGWEIPDPGLPGVRLREFEGPHPAGNPGLHIHLVDPVDRDRDAWHLNLADAIAIGELLETGQLPVERIVSVGGPAVLRPRLLRTRSGADLGELLAGELSAGDHRVISGSVLDGRGAAGEVEGYLGRYHNQISVLREGGRRRLFGWLSPGIDAYSTTRLFLSRLLPGKRFALDTGSNGEERGLVPIGNFDKVMPFDVLPIFLARALLAGDLDTAEELGCLELEEEDVALLTFVCPSKIDYGAALREVLTKLEEEG